MLFLTADQHREVLRRLIAVGERSARGIRHHRVSLEYSSLMLCFLLQNLSAAETFSRLFTSFGMEWYPVGVSYAVVRVMFEVDVTAHYITQSPLERARQYVDFGAILTKRSMDACKKHCGSKDLQWQEAMRLEWQNHWAPREIEVNKQFEAVAHSFKCTNKKGKTAVFQNWSGKTLRQMATEVDHLEAYDTFYGELSSFAHADVHLADRYLRSDSDGPIWSQRAGDGDVGNVFRHAASFLTCFLELFGKQFGTCTEKDVSQCWQIDSHSLNH